MKWILKPIKLMSGHSVSTLTKSCGKYINLGWLLFLTFTFLSVIFKLFSVIFFSASLRTGIRMSDFTTVCIQTMELAKNVLSYPLPIWWPHLVCLLHPAFSGAICVSVFSLFITFWERVFILACWFLGRKQSLFSILLVIFLVIFLTWPTLLSLWVLPFAFLNGYLLLLANSKEQSPSLIFSILP